MAAHLRHIAMASTLALACTLPQAQTAPAPAGATRTVITSSEQLPRRTVTLARLPSEYLAGPREQLLPLAAQLEANLRGDLERPGPIFGSGTSADATEEEAPEDPNAPVPIEPDNR